MAWERSWARERSDGKRKNFDCTAIAAPDGREGVCAGERISRPGGGRGFLGEAVAVEGSGGGKKMCLSPAVGGSSRYRHRIRGVDSHACDPGS